MLNPVEILYSALIIFGMVGVSVGSAVWWQKKTKTPWRWFLWGASLISLALAIKYLFGLLINNRVSILLSTYLPGNISSWVFYLYIGGLTVLTEVWLTYVLIKKRLARAEISGVIAFGIGYGGAEATAIGFMTFALLLAAILVPNLLPPELLKSSGLSTLTMFAPILERASAIAINILAAYLLFKAAQEKKWTPFFLVCLLKGIVDTLFPPLSILKEMGTEWILLLEIPIILWAVASLLAFRGYLKDAKAEKVAALILFSVTLVVIALFYFFAPTLTTPEQYSVSVSQTQEQVGIDPACISSVKIARSNLEPTIPAGKNLTLNKCIEDRENLPPQTIIAFQEEERPGLRLGIILEKEEREEGVFYIVLRGYEPELKETVSAESILAIREQK